MTTTPKGLMVAASAIAAAAMLAMVNPGSLLAQAHAVLVRDVDHPARQPVSLQANFFLSGAAGNGALEICTAAPACVPVVPAGKRLVIEFLSVRAFVGSSETLANDMSVVARLGSKSLTYHLDVTFQGSQADPGLPLGRVYRATHMVRIYADPGTEVAVLAARSPAGPELGTVRLAGTGYLVDLN